METKAQDNKKQITINARTHQLLKVLAAEVGRCINGDLADDLIMLGIEEYRRAKKNFAHDVTSTGYKGEKAEA